MEFLRSRHLFSHSHCLPVEALSCRLEKRKEKKRKEKKRKEREGSGVVPTLEVVTISSQLLRLDYNGLRLGFVIHVKGGGTDEGSDEGGLEGGLKIIDFGPPAAIIDSPGGVARSDRGGTRN